MKFSKKVLKRMVVTDSVDKEINYKNVKIDLISLARFLKA